MIEQCTQTMLMPDGGACRCECEPGHEGSHFAALTVVSEDLRQHCRILWDDPPFPNLPLGSEGAK